MRVSLASYENLIRARINTGIHIIARLTRPPNRHRAPLFRLASIVITIVYIVGWSIISIHRFYAMKANVSDLGYVVNLIHLIPYKDWTLEAITTQLANQGILFLLTPLSFTNSIPAVLIFQSVVLGIPAYLIFEIAFKESGKTSLAILSSIAYLLYFPLAGANWSDFQIMDMFVFLFLLAYLLFLYEKFLLAFLVFTISGMVRFPYMILVVVAQFSLLIPIFLSKLRNRQYQLEVRDKWVFSIFAVSSVLLILQYIWISHTNPAIIVTHASSNRSPFLDLDKKLYTVFILLAPLLFLPLFSKKWLLPSMVFFAIIFLFNSPVYEYPALFLNWYSVAIAPFLFLGLIEVLSTLSRRLPDRTRSENSRASHRYFTLIKRQAARLVAASIVVVLVSLAFFVQPYGPYNSSSFNDFNFAEDTHVNMTLFNAASDVIGLIPENETSILVQNDLPQLFPRAAIKFPLVAPYSIGPNITAQDIAHNTFPFDLGSLSGRVPINYSISDFNDIHSLTEPPVVSGFPTMLEMDHMLQNSSYYGIVAENKGVTLLERGYTGSLIQYSPFSKKVDLNEIASPQGSFSDGVFEVNGPVSNITMRSPFLDLFPGTFSVTLSASFTSNSNSSLKLESGYYVSTSHFIFLNKTIFYFNSSNSGNNRTFTINMNLSNFVGNAQFFIVPFNFPDGIYLKSIQVMQVSGPSPF